MDLAAGLAPGNRFRCTACGNLTRFDVTTTERTRRFHHLELGGEGGVEEEELLSRTVEQVACRWCSRDDAIAVEPVAGRRDPAPSDPASDASVGDDHVGEPVAGEPVAGEPASTGTTSDPAVSGDPAAT